MWILQTQQYYSWYVVILVCFLTQVESYWIRSKMHLVQRPVTPSGQPVALKKPNKQGPKSENISFAQHCFYTRKFHPVIMASSHCYSSPPYIRLMTFFKAISSRGIAFSMNKRSVLMTKWLKSLVYSCFTCPNSLLITSCKWNVQEITKNKQTPKESLILSSYYVGKSFTIWENTADLPIFQSEKKSKKLLS